MFKTIHSQIKPDPDYPSRAYEMDIMSRILNGTIYDHLPNGFHEEKNVAGEYIAIRNRRPCVHSNLCKIVVDDSVSLLFSEGHFPEIECKDDNTRDILTALIKESKLNGVMVDAATRGSIGSIAIFFKVIQSRVFLEVMDTIFITPIWDVNCPDILDRAIETYKCKGSCFIEAGIAVPDANETYWYRREWTKTQEIHFQPQSILDKKEGKPPVEDITKTVNHNLGFNPIIWVKNLPGKADNVDGSCTFKPAVETQIEIDYQLSQCGRGLKYASDPTLLIKEPAFGGENSAARQGGAANALIVSAEGDAKLLEINGTAANAVIEYVRCLREMGLESIHGNRVSADKIATAQSGRAMEMMNQALIWLADKLRTPYGEGALLDILNMIVKVNQKMDLTINGENIAKKTLSTKEKISLRWPAWYPPTASDLVSMANALATLIEAGAMSRDTAIKSIASVFDVEDTTAEKALIDAEIELNRKHELEMKTKEAKQVPKVKAKGEVKEK